MSEEGRAMRANRFRDFPLNTNGRKEAVRSRHVSIRKEPWAADLDLATIARGYMKALAGEMIASASGTPATLGEPTRARAQIECMVGQIEWETSRREGNEELGRIPALFTTIAAPLCKFEKLNRAIRIWIGALRQYRGEIRRVGGADSSSMRTHARRSQSGILLLISRWS